MGRAVFISCVVNVVFWWILSDYHTIKINVESLTRKPTMVYKIRKQKPIQEPPPKPEVEKLEKKEEIKEKPVEKPIEKPKELPQNVVKEPTTETTEDEVEDVQELEKVQKSDRIVDSTELDVEIYPIQKVVPKYPSVAKKTGVEAEVYLEVIISPKGRVEHAEVVYCSKPGYEFEQSALDAVTTLRFEPVIQDGEAVRVKIIYPIEFVLVE